MDANLRATLAVFALARRGGETREEYGLSLVSSRVDYAMFNSASLTAPVSTPAELFARLKDAAAFYRDRRLPWSVWLCAGWLMPAALDAAHRMCEAAGLSFVAQLPAMQAERLSGPTSPLPQLDIRRVEDAQTREGFTLLMCRAFGVPHSAARSIYVSESTWRGPLSGYVGYSGGEIVTCAATVVHAGVAGVYAVGTVPERQRRGYAEAVMRHALADTEARFGAYPTILQSSAAGYRLYERMGFRTVTRYLVFAST
jgi:ribosomal protein S18 acetylase RimI-like enzyme